MKIETRERDGVAILALTGEMLIGDVSFQKAMESLRQQGRNRFVVDMTSVDYVDAGGLGEIVREWTITTRNGGRLVFVIGYEPQTSKFADLLRQTRLNTVFAVFDCEEDAITAAQETN